MFDLAFSEMKLLDLCFSDQNLTGNIFVDLLEDTIEPLIIHWTIK